MKIISGKYANREIEIVGRTRPPLTRIRQYIFDVLKSNYPFDDKIILDLCAGSGSLGLEALSRGARFAYFFEENLETARNLMKTISNWNIDNAKVSIKNVKYLPQTNYPADLIFFDPPFGHEYIEYVQNKIVNKNWSNDDSVLMIRSDHEIKTENPFWTLDRIKIIGVSKVHFYLRTKQILMQDI